MNRSIGCAILMLLLAGCQIMPVEKAPHPDVGSEQATTEAKPKSAVILQVSHVQDLPIEGGEQQVEGAADKVEGTNAEAEVSAEEAEFSADLVDATEQTPIVPPGLPVSTLSEFEQLAFATNPAIAEIDAEIESLRGKLTQAGLPPNPVVGINGDDINEDGAAGRYGVYFGREIVRGNKLGLARSVVCAEIKAAERRREVVQQRLLTDVRQAFFNLLIVQERITTFEQLVELSRQAVVNSQKLVDAEEIAQTSLLQAELELQNAEVILRQARNQNLGARRQLAALINEAELPFESVVGDIRSISELDEFESSYDRLVISSPEIAALFAEVEQQRRNLCRQIAEPIPNVTWQSTLQFDTVTDDIVAGFQIGMPIPTLNRNQGAICQARYSIISAERRAEKKALDLRQRLAKAYQDYIDSKIQVEAFENEIIPKAGKTVDLIAEAYREGELSFLEWLTAQRTWSQTQLAWLNQLQTLWDRHWAVQGMLLNGSLAD